MPPELTHWIPPAVIVGVMLYLHRVTRQDMSRLEGRLREDMKDLRGEVADLRDRMESQNGDLRDRMGRIEGRMGFLDVFQRWG